VLADVWGPYFVSIAGVLTVGVLGFVVRFVWRWATSIRPTLVFVDVWPDELRVLNQGDFVVHVHSVEALGDPDPWALPIRPPGRVAPNTHTALLLQPPVVLPFRVDRFYRLVLRDDRYARWQVTYDPADRVQGGFRGPGNAAVRFRGLQLERIWPYSVAWAIATWRGFVNALPPGGASQ
jgi:hypothetical protein